MIPYIHVPDFHVGPLPLHPFGMLVAAGVYIGMGVTVRRARALGYDVDQLNSFLGWMLVSAFLLSHALDSLFYHWDEVVRRPWSLALPWEGLSSFGGFVGAIAGIFLWKYLVLLDGKLRVRQKPAPILPFADLVLSVLPLGWMFGRAGCSTVHDHPGARTTADNLLAVAYPFRHGDGTVTHVGFIEFIHGHDYRYDLGTLELMFTVILVVCFAMTWRRRVPVGSYIIATALAYSPVRFVMDYLRIPASEGGDTRYAGLTPAQYGCVALFLFGLAMIFYVRRSSGRADPVSGVLATPHEGGDEGSPATT